LYSIYHSTYRDNQERSYVTLPRGIRGKYLPGTIPILRIVYDTGLADLSPLDALINTRCIFVPNYNELVQLNTVYTGLSPLGYFLCLSITSKYCPLYEPFSRWITSCGLLMPPKPAPPFPVNLLIRALPRDAERNRPRRPPVV
jgi:hypothetical protein